jgi:hypothetical protein
MSKNFIVKLAPPIFAAYFDGLGQKLVFPIFVARREFRQATSTLVSSGIRASDPYALQSGI